MDLYFETFDHKAVTTEDFLWAMQKANSKTDLSKMQRWYEQAGTPVVDVISNYDEKKKEYTLFFRQTCPETFETK
jgi:aminopeptidase N